MARQPVVAGRAEQLLGSAVVATSPVAGGDICTAWTAYLTGPRGQMAQAAFANCDLTSAQMAVDSFMLWQSRETVADAPPTGADAPVPPRRPMSEAEYEKAIARCDDRIRAGESPVKVNAERADLTARFASGKP